MQAPESPGSPWPLDDLTSIDNIEAIIASEDKIVRNLLITQSYHELASALARQLDPDNISWCAFATWASRQAGQFIRNEEVPAWLRRFLRLDIASPNAQPPDSRLGNWIRSWPLMQYIRRTVEDVSEYIARGNRMVRARLAPLFARFLLLIQDRDAPDPAALKRFLTDIGYGPATGQELRDAFMYYYRARFEPSLKRKAELMFMGNVLIGDHEQRRLQFAIEGALSAPINRVLKDLDAYLSRFRWLSPLRQTLLRICKWCMDRWIQYLMNTWRQAATEVLMTLAVPGRQIRLGDDMPRLPSGGSYPYVLRTLINCEARQLVQTYDRNPNTLRGSGANDWTRLDDRMNFIIDLFRSRQQTLNLLQAPFCSAQQVTDMKAGRIPTGGPL